MNKKNLLILLIIISVSFSSFNVFAVSIQNDELTVEIYNENVEKYALLVGVGIASCPYTIYDVLDMRDALISHGWKNSNIKCLTGLIEASKSSILNNIEGWLDFHEDSNDIVLFYFSGHGSYNHIMGANIISGGDPDKYEISGHELDYSLSKLESKKILVILDSCYSGSFTEIINPVSNPGRMILASCGPLETSTYSPDHQNGIFTFYLSCALDFVHGFSNVDRNKDNWISANEAFSYAKKTVPFSNIFQHPHKYDGIPDDLLITKQNKKIKSLKLLLSFREKNFLNKIL